MKVTSVTPLLVHPGWRKSLLFVKVETDAGLSGWGGSYTQYDRDTVIASHVHELGRYLAGRSPFNIKHFMQRPTTTSCSGEVRWTPGPLSAASNRRCGISLATPLNSLSTNYWVAPADSVSAFMPTAAFGLESPEEYARAAESMVERGFTAMKFDPLPGPWRTFVPRYHERSAAGLVRAVKDAVGPEVDLLIEVHRRLAPMHAIRLAGELER